jgi:hypothetical protein
MRRIEQKSNPTVLEITVRFRNKKGHFTKPHLASSVEFIPARARKSVRRELPKGRKTKAKAIAFAKQAVIAEMKIRDAVILSREREERERLPAQRRADKPKFPKLTVKRTSTVTRSKVMAMDVRIIGYNFTFVKKIPIYPKNFDLVADYLQSAMSEAGVRIFKKDKAWGQKFYAKVFGSGYYMREKGKKRVKDQIGFSVSRAEVFSPNEIESHVEFTIDNMRVAFMPSRTARGFVSGYFSHKFQNNEYYITGFRIERVEELE